MRPVLAASETLFSLFLTRNPLPSELTCGSAFKVKWCENSPCAWLCLIKSLHGDQRLKRELSGKHSAICRSFWSRGDRKVKQRQKKNHADHSCDFSFFFSWAWQVGREEKPGHCLDIPTLEPDNRGQLPRPETELSSAGKPEEYYLLLHLHLRPHLGSKANSDGH